MNKVEQEHVWRVVNRAKQCLLGKIAADIDSRLPEKPTNLSDWEKYKLIRDGIAILKKNFTVKQIMSTYRSDSILLVDAFTYPVREEEKIYDKALKSVETERLDREMAVETAFNRLADERVMGLIDAKTFLDSVERMQQEKW